MPYCPICQKQYPGGQTHCKFDGSPLSPSDPSATEPADALLGQVLDDRYRIDRLLGSGGMGKVYQATNLNTDRIYALKVMHSKLLHHEEARKRFVREARTIAAINHPYIVEIYDFGQTPSDAPFLVMEYLQGTTLRACMQDSTGGGLTLSQALRIATQIGQALRYIHARGIVHRDIKPDNIQLVPHDEQAIFAKLFDFGVARIQSQEAVTQLAGGLPASWAYAPPEVHRGSGEPNPAIDIYALAVTLFEIITNQRPFAGDAAEVVWGHLQLVAPRLSQVAKDLHIPAKLDSLVAQMLEKDPARRPSAELVAHQLEIFSAHLPVSNIHIHSLRTYEFPKNEEGGQISDNQPVATPNAGEPRDALQMLKKARDIDEIESGRERVTAQVARECQSLLKRGWLSEIPADISDLLKRSAQIQEEMLTLETNLAILHEAVAQEREALEAERDRLRQQIQELRDERRAVNASQKSAGSAAAQKLAHLERAYAAPGPPSPIVEKVHQEEIRRQQLRDELLATQRKLAERLLRAVRDTGQRRAYGAESMAIALRAQRIARALSQLDGLNELLRRY